MTGLFLVHTQTHTHTHTHIHTHTHAHTMTISRTHERTRAGAVCTKKDSSVGTLTTLGAGRSEVRFLLENVQIGSGTHSAFYAMCTRVLSG